MRDTKASLKWISNILKQLNIPFQITGGLAAKTYGATRDLVDIDIDIPNNQLKLVNEHVKEFVTFGPAHLITENWDLELITLNHHGQEIDLSGSDHTKIFNRATGQWQEINTDLSKSILIEVLDLKMPVISKESLIFYKKILARPVDLTDIEEIE